MSHSNTGAALVPPTAQTQPSSTARDDYSGLPIDEELKLLREENAKLLEKVEELENLVVAASQDAETRWTECQREYESLIEEKTEVIRTLHQKNTELRGRATGAAADGAAAEALEGADRQELLRLKQVLQDQHRQMKDDEDSMMGQLRQMEMALAKDRAELARQRADVMRLHQELKHELEMAARDPGLRDRLGSLQRRATTLGNVRSRPSDETPRPATLPKPQVPVSPNVTKSGLFRRIFGAGES